MTASLNTSQCPRPKGFREAVEPSQVSFAGVGPFVRKQGRARGALKAGMAYEKKIRGTLTTIYGESPLQLNPWISFISQGRRRYAQPDGVLLVNGESISLIEVKLKHTATAWWQTRRLYEPLLKMLYPNFSISICEICKYYDPFIPFPEPQLSVMEPADVPAGRFGVCVWKQ